MVGEAANGANAADTAGQIAHGVDMGNTGDMGSVQSGHHSGPGAHIVLIILNGVSGSSEHIQHSLGDNETTCDVDTGHEYGAGS